MLASGNWSEPFCILVMEAFIRYVVGNLVSDPDKIDLTSSETPRKITFRLKLPPAEMGKVIGKQGRTITAIRNLLSATASRNGQKALLQLEE